MTRYDNLQDAAFSISYALEAAAKKAGWEIADTGASVQSCSTYVTLRQEDDDADTERYFAIRISDHTARSCISPVNFHIALGGKDWTAEAKIGLAEVEEDGDFVGFEADTAEIAVAVTTALKAAAAAEWDEI